MAFNVIPAHVLFRFRPAAGTSPRVNVCATWLRAGRPETIAEACAATRLDPNMWNTWERDSDNPPAIDLLLQLGNHFELSGRDLEWFLFAAALGIRRCPQCRIELSHVSASEPWHDEQLECSLCDGTCSSPQSHLKP